MVTDSGIQAHRDPILRIAESYGARNLRLFGSVARGEARPDSDLGLLVDLEPGRSLFELGGLLTALQELSGRRGGAAHLDRVPRRETHTRSSRGSDRRRTG